MATFSMPNPQFRSGAPYRDTDECSYFTTLTASSNMTADNLPGAGRNLGNLYSFLGRHLESAVGRAAERLGYGPHQAIIRIHRQRLITASKHMTGHWKEEIDQIDQILRDGRLLDMSEDHYWLLRDFSSRLPSSKEKLRVEKYCKRLIRYVRSNVESTKQQALDYIIELAFEDEYVRELLSGMGAINVIKSLQSNPALWINCGASLQSSSRKALLVLGEAEVHTFALKFKDYDKNCDSRNSGVCLRALADYLHHPSYSFVAIRYLRQITFYLFHMIDQFVDGIAKAINANCDIVEFEECDHILQNWLGSYNGLWVDKHPAVLEIMFRYAEKLPRTVSSKSFQEWLWDLETGHSRTSERKLHAHYTMAVLLKGIAAVNRLGDKDFRATYSHPALQPFPHVLESPSDLALSQFAFEEDEVPGAEKLKCLCEKLATFASNTDSQIRERAWRCAKVLLTTNDYCCTAMLKALSLTQIRYPMEFASLVEEARKRLDNTPISRPNGPHSPIRHCDAEGRLLHIINEYISRKRCDSSRGCVMEHEISIGWEDVLTLHLEHGRAFSSAGLHPILAGHTVNGEKAYLAGAHFSDGYCYAECFITEGAKPEDLRIQTRNRDEGDLEERTPILLSVDVLRWALDMYPDWKYRKGLDATGPFSWEHSVENPRDHHLPRTEAYISDLDMDSGSEITFNTEEKSTDEQMDFSEEDDGSPEEESGMDVEE